MLDEDVGVVDLSRTVSSHGWLRPSPPWTGLRACSGKVYHDRGLWHRIIGPDS